MTREKRRHKRESLTAEVSYKDEKTKSFGGCITKDLSESGVCIKIGEFLPVGTILDLQFALPLSSTAFYVKAKIVRINKLPYNEQWEAGLEMVMDMKYVKLVQEYIASKTKDNPEYHL